MVHTTVIPKNRVVNLSFTVPEDYVGEEVEIIAFTKKESDINAETLSPSLPGDPLSNKAFKDWIANAELLPTTSLEEAKTKWLKKKSLLAKFTK